MTIMGMSEEDQMNVLQAVAGVLHLGNVTFVEDGNYAMIEDEQCKNINLCHFIFIYVCSCCESKFFIY